MVGGVNETADRWWVVSVTPLTTGGRYQWHRASILTPLTNWALHFRACCLIWRESTFAQKYGLPLKKCVLRCHWHRRPHNWRFLCEFESTVYAKRL
jgi:hypothetical protein